ncbi:hypothetical protein L6R50_14105 [Myxococcota bacterium]|nr:hypothetical protein [Myxococcota bacterium]
MPRLPLAAALLALTPLLLGATSPRPVRPGPGDCFLGLSDPRFTEWRQATEDACRVGLARAEARLGLSAPGARIRCVVTTREARRLPHDDWRYATTTTLPDGSVETFFAAEALASGALRLPQTAVHEMTHALLRAAMGETYVAVDPWFREGLAVWAAGQGQERLDNAVARAVATNRGATPTLAMLLDGLPSVPGEAHGADDYAEDFLAFEWLEERAGETAVGAVARRVAAGVAPLAAFSEEAGLDEGEVLGAVDGHARRRVSRAIRSAHAAALRSCGRKLDRGRSADAAACFDRFVARHPGSAVSDAARMLGAVAWQRADRPNLAREALAPVAASGSPFADEARDRIAAALEREGQPEAALHAACSALRDGFTRHAPHLSFVAARALMRLDSPAAAAPWLERIVSRYAASRYADGAERLLAEARRRLTATGADVDASSAASPHDADGRPPLPEPEAPPPER